MVVLWLLWHLMKQDRYVVVECYDRFEENCSHDGWITCDFTSFSTIFQSYQDDGWVVMKGCVQSNAVHH